MVIVRAPLLAKLDQGDSFIRELEWVVGDRKQFGMVKCVVIGPVLEPLGNQNSGEGANLTLTQRRILDS